MVPESGSKPSRGHIRKDSHHPGFLQGYFIYKNVSEDFLLPTFSPTLLGDSHMLYFWFSEQVLDSLAKIAFQDDRLVLSLTGPEFKVRSGVGLLEYHVFT